MKRGTRDTMFAWVFGFAMSFMLLVLVVLAGKAHAGPPPGVPAYMLPDDPRKPEGEQAAYYSVPLVKRDGSLEKLDIDAGLTLVFLLCREREDEKVECIAHWDKGLFTVVL